MEGRSGLPDSERDWAGMEGDEGGCGGGGNKMNRAPNWTSSILAEAFHGRIH